MNVIVTSREEILKISRELVQRQGWSAVNMRSVAAACGVSIGSIYHYFDSKSELLSAIVESVWHEIFHVSENRPVFQDIQSCITWLYGQIAYGCRHYPGFFTLHALMFLEEDRSSRRLKMQQAWRHIREELSAVLVRDKKIRSNAFTGNFTAEKFVDILFSLMISAFLQQEDDPSAVLEMVRRTLYEPGGGCI